MVIHLQNACAAHSTVVTSVRLELTTPLAVPSFSTFLRLLETHRCVGDFRFCTSAVSTGEVLPFGIIGDFSGMGQDASYIANHQHHCGWHEDSELTHASNIRISGQNVLAVQQRKDVLGQIDGSQQQLRQHHIGDLQRARGMVKGFSLGPQFLGLKQRKCQGLRWRYL